MNTIDQELWSDISHFSRYQVSNLGSLRNVIFDNRPMAPSKMMSVRRPDGPDGEIVRIGGNLKISLIDNDGVRHTVMVARLVAEAFVEAPSDMCTEVIHLDGDLSNVSASNLRWRSPRTASLYMRQLHTPPKVPWTNLMVRNMNTGVVYENIVTCGKTEGVVWQEVWESTYTKPTSHQKQVPPYWHTYEIVKYEGEL